MNDVTDASGYLVGHEWRLHSCLIHCKPLDCFRIGEPETFAKISFTFSEPKMATFTHDETQNVAAIKSALAGTASRAELAECIAALGQRETLQTAVCIRLREQIVKLTTKVPTSTSILSKPSSCRVGPWVKKRRPCRRFAGFCRAVIGSVVYLGSSLHLDIPVLCRGRHQLWEPQDDSTTFPKLALCSTG